MCFVYSWRRSSSKVPLPGYEVMLEDVSDSQKASALEEYSHL